MTAITTTEQSRNWNPYAFTTTLSNTEAFISTLSGTVARLGGLFYDCLPEDARQSSFENASLCLWASLAVVPVIEFFASVSITYIALSVLAILSLQFIVTSTLRRGSGDDLNMRFALRARNGGNNNDLEEAHFLAAAGARDGFTELMGAVRSQNLEAVNLLLTTNQAQINAQDALGYTALMWAAVLGYAEIARVLMTAGADFNKKERDDNQTALMLAAKRGHTATVQALLESTALRGTIDQVDLFGKTALTLAIDSHHVEIVRVLVREGANLNQQGGHDNRTPLMTAVDGSRTSEQLEIVQALLASSSLHPNVQDRSGNTALHLLVRNSSLDEPYLAELLTLLLGNPLINPNLVNRLGHTPLVTFLSRALPMQNTVGLLAERSDLTLQDTNGLTPLDHAILSGYAENVTILVRKGARLVGTMDYRCSELRRSHGAAMRNWAIGRASELDWAYQRGLPPV